MARYVLVDGGIVGNVIEWDGDAEAEGAWAPPKGAVAVASDEAQIGWSYANGAFTPPAPPVPAVPQVVSPRQMRLAMLAAGVLPQVQAFVDGPDASEAVRIAWEYATEFHRDDAMIDALAQMLGMTSADIDDLFHAAAAIQ